MDRQRGRLIATIIIGAGLIGMLAYLVANPPSPPRPSITTTKFSIPPVSAQHVKVGANVHAAEGPIVGTVEHIARDRDGGVTRIRFATARPLGIGHRILTLRAHQFVIDGNVVRLRLPQTAIDGLPEVMIRDDAATLDAPVPDLEQ
jgi:hypothetical protein